MSKLDEVAYDSRFAPYWGWHGDHSGHPSYLPALQQDRAEFHEFADLLHLRGINGRCLQLGLGMSGAAHFAFMSMFREVMTIDHDLGLVETFMNRHGLVPTIFGGNTHDVHVRNTVAQSGQFDCLFIDAGHLLDDVRADFWDYQPLVRRGGIIALHDAAQIGVPGIDVPQFLNELRIAEYQVHMIDTNNIGIAWVTT